MLQSLLINLIFLWIYLDVSQFSRYKFIEYNHAIFKTCKRGDNHLQFACWQQGIRWTPYFTWKCLMQKMVARSHPMLKVRGPIVKTSDTTQTFKLVDRLKNYVLTVSFGSQLQITQIDITKQLQGQKNWDSKIIRSQIESYSSYLRDHIDPAIMSIIEPIMIDVFWTHSPISL